MNDRIGVDEAFELESISYRARRLFVRLQLLASLASLLYSLNASTLEYLSLPKLLLLQDKRNSHECFRRKGGCASRRTDLPSQPLPLIIFFLPFTPLNPVIPHSKDRLTIQTLPRSWCRRRFPLRTCRIRRECVCKRRRCAALR